MPESISIDALLRLKTADAERQLAAIGRKQKPVVIPVRFDAGEVSKAFADITAVAISNKLRTSFNTIGDDLTKKIETAFAKSKVRSSGGGLLGGLTNIVTAPLKGLARGAFEGVGREISRKFGVGLSKGIESEISQFIGSTDFLGEKLVAKVVPDLTKNAIAKIRATKLGEQLAEAMKHLDVQEARENLKQRFRDLLGDSDLLIEQEFNRGVRAKGKKQKTLGARKEAAGQLQQELAIQPQTVLRSQEIAKQIELLEKQSRQERNSITQIAKIAEPSPVNVKQIEILITNLKARQKEIEKLQQEQQKLFKPEAQEKLAKLGVDTKSVGLVIRGVDRHTDSAKKALSVFKQSEATLKQDISFAQKELPKQRENLAKLQQAAKEALSDNEIALARAIALKIAESKANINKLTQVIETSGQKLKIIAAKQSELSQVVSGSVEQKLILSLQQQIEIIQKVTGRSASEITKAIAIGQIQTLDRVIDKAKAKAIKDVKVIQKAIAKGSTVNESTIAQGESEIATTALGKLIAQKKKVEQSTQQLFEEKSKLVAQRNRGEDVEKTLKVVELQINDRVKQLTELRLSLQKAESENFEDFQKIQEIETQKSILQAAKTAATNLTKANQAVVNIDALAKEEIEKLNARLREIAVDTEQVTEKSKVKSQKSKVKTQKSISEPQKIVNKIAAEVERISGVAFESIPDLVEGIDLPDGAKGSFDPATNKLALSKELFNQLQNSQITEQISDVIVHELRHGLQQQVARTKADLNELLTSNTFLVSPTGTERGKLQSAIDFSVNSVDDPNFEAQRRILEEDAYTFTYRYLNEITNNIGLVQSAGLAKLNSELEDLLSQIKPPQLPKTPAISSRNFPLVNDSNELEALLEKQVSASGLKEIVKRLGLGTDSPVKKVAIERIVASYKNDALKVQELIGRLGDDIKLKAVKTGAGSSLGKVEDEPALSEAFKANRRVLGEAFKQLETLTGEQREVLQKQISAIALEQIDTIDRVTREFKVAGKTGQSLSGTRSQFTAIYDFERIKQAQVQMQSTLASLGSLDPTDAIKSITEIEPQIKAFLASVRQLDKTDEVEKVRTQLEQQFKAIKTAKKLTLEAVEFDYKDLLSNPKEYVNLLKDSAIAKAKTGVENKLSQVVANIVEAARQNISQALSQIEQTALPERQTAKALPAAKTGEIAISGSNQLSTQAQVINTVSSLALRAIADITATSKSALEQAQALEKLVLDLNPFLKVAKTGIQAATPVIAGGALISGSPEIAQAAKFAAENLADVIQPLIAVLRAGGANAVGDLVGQIPGVGGVSQAVIKGLLNNPAFNAQIAEGLANVTTVAGIGAGAIKGGKAAVSKVAQASFKALPESLQDRLTPESITAFDTLVAQRQKEINVLAKDVQHNIQAIVSTSDKSQVTSQKLLAGYNQVTQQIEELEKFSVKAGIETLKRTKDRLNQLRKVQQGLKDSIPEVTVERVIKGDSDNLKNIGRLYSAGTPLTRNDLDRDTAGFAIGNIAATASQAAGANIPLIGAATAIATMKPAIAIRNQILESIDAESLVNDIIDGLSVGLNQNLARVASQGQRLADELLEGFRDRLGIHSPSEEFESEMKNVADGAEIGAKKQLEKFEEIGKDLGDKLSQGFDPTLDPLSADSEEFKRIEEIGRQKAIEREQAARAEKEAKKQRLSAESPEEKEARRNTEREARREAQRLKKERNIALGEQEEQDLIKSKQQAESEFNSKLQSFEDLQQKSSLTTDDESTLKEVTKFFKDALQELLERELSGELKGDIPRQNRLEQSKSVVRDLAGLSIQVDPVKRTEVSPQARGDRSIVSKDIPSDKPIEDAASHVDEQIKDFNDKLKEVVTETVEAAEESIQEAITSVDAVEPQAIQSSSDVGEALQQLDDTVQESISTSAETVNSEIAKVDTNSLVEQKQKLTVPKRADKISASEQKITQPSAPQDASLEPVLKQIEDVGATLQQLDDTVQQSISTSTETIGRTVQQIETVIQASEREIKPANRDVDRSVEPVKKSIGSVFNVFAQLQTKRRQIINTFLDKYELKTRLAAKRLNDSIKQTLNLRSKGQIDYNESDFDPADVAESFEQFMSARQYGNYSKSVDNIARKQIEDVGATLQQVDDTVQQQLDTVIQLTSESNITKKEADKISKQANKSINRFDRAFAGIFRSRFEAQKNSADGAIAQLESQTKSQEKDAQKATQNLIARIKKNLQRSTGAAKEIEARSQNAEVIRQQETARQIAQTQTRVFKNQSIGSAPIQISNEQVASSNLISNLKTAIASITNDLRNAGLDKANKEAQLVTLATKDLLANLNVTVTVGKDAAKKISQANAAIASLEKEQGRIIKGIGNLKGEDKLRVKAEVKRIQTEIEEEQKRIAELKIQQTEGKKLISVYRQLTDLNEQLQEAIASQDTGKIKDLNRQISDVHESLNQPPPSDGGGFFDGIQEQLDKFGLSLENIKGGLAGIAALAVTSLFGDNIGEFLTQANETASRFQDLQQQIDFATGGEKEGAAATEFIRAEASRLKIDVEAATAGFATLAAATRDTELEGMTTRINSVLLQAGRVTGQSAEQAEGAFLAAQQIITGGTLQLEELRQLGESGGIKGVFKIAADSMGVSIQEMKKLISTGKILSTDFMPKFIDQLDKVTRSGVADALNTQSAALANVTNKYKLLLNSIGEKTQATATVGLNALGKVIELVEQNLTIIIPIVQGLALLLAGSLLPTVVALVKVAGGFLLNGLRQVFTALPLINSQLLATNTQLTILASSKLKLSFQAMNSLVIATRALTVGLVAVGAAVVTMQLAEAFTNTKKAGEEARQAVKSIEDAVIDLQETLAKKTESNLLPEELTKLIADRNVQAVKDSQNFIQKAVGGAIDKTPKILNKAIKRSTIFALLPGKTLDTYENAALSPIENATGEAISANQKLLADADSKLGLRDVTQKSTEELKAYAYAVELASDSVKGALDAAVDPNQIQQLNAELSENQKRLELYNAELKRRGDRELSLAKIAIAKEDTVQAAQRAEIDALAAIDEEILKSGDFKKDVELQKLQITQTRIDAELEAERKALAQIKELAALKGGFDPKTGKPLDPQQLEDYEETEKKIIELTRTSIETRQSLLAKETEQKLAEYDRYLEKVEARRQEAEDKVIQSEKERLIELTLLYNDNLIDAQTLEDLKVKSQASRIKSELDEEKEKLRQLKKFRSSEVEVREKADADIKASKSKVLDLTLQLLEQEKQAEEKNN